MNVRVSSLVCLLLLGACDAETRPSYDRRPMLKSLALDVMLPRFAALQSKTRALEEAVDAFCSAPDEKSLLTAQNAWKEAREPWKGNEVIAFGPSVDAPLRAGPKLDFWPARPRDIEKRLGSDEAVTAEALNEAGVTVRGLSVLEYLLFDPVTDVLSKFLDESTGTRRCSYAQGLAEDIAIQARTLNQAWQPKHGNFVNQLVEPGAGVDPVFDDVHCAASEIVDRMVFTIENVRMLKIAKPAGITQGAGAMPELAESRFSDHSLTDARNAVLGVRELFEGPGKALGIVDWLAATKPTLEQAVREDFDAAIDAIDAIEPPFSDAVQDRPKTVRRAYDALGDLQRVLGVDMAGALGVSVTFNDTDGD